MVNMDTLKTKTAKSNHVVFNFVSILSTSHLQQLRYRALIDNVCL